MSQKPNGLFISLEGVDGAGKSSHIPAMRDFFVAQGRNVIVTREPGGTPVAEKIRSLLLSTENAMSNMSEILMMFASRADHLEQVIRPALARGDVVICDRFTDSTIAFQCGGRGFDEDFVIKLANKIHPDCWPHMTLLFDVPISVAKKRLEGRRDLDRIELAEEAFHVRVRNRYLAGLPHHGYNGLRLRVIDATQTLEEIRIEVLLHCAEASAADHQVAVIVNG